MEGVMLRLHQGRGRQTWGVSGSFLCLEVVDVSRSNPNSISVSSPLTLTGSQAGFRPHRVRSDPVLRDRGGQQNPAALSASEHGLDFGFCFFTAEASGSAGACSVSSLAFGAFSAGFSAGAATGSCSAGFSTGAAVAGACSEASPASGASPAGSDPLQASPVHLRLRPADQPTSRCRHFQSSGTFRRRLEPDL